MTPIDNRYPDLLGEQSDPDLKHLIEDLETLSQAFKSSKMSSQRDAAIAQTLRERATAKRQRKAPAALFRPRKRLARRTIVLVFAIIGLLAIAGTVIARTPLINQALSWFDDRSQQTTHHILGQVVNIPQSACGFTVTIQRVYADANDVIVGYTIKAPSNRRFIGGFNFDTDMLTDAQGVIYPDHGGGGTGTFENQTGDVREFDAGGTINHPHVLNMHLVIPTIFTTERIDDTSHRFATCEAYHPLKKDEAPQSLDYTKLRDVTVTGPFTFNFSVPFASGEELDLNQTVESGGTKVTLERVVVTPFETRLYVRGVTPATQADVSVNGQAITFSGVSLPENGVVIFSDNTLLNDQHGAWRVVITSRPDLAYVTKGGAPVGGPWVFSFNMP